MTNRQIVLERLPGAERLAAEHFSLRAGERPAPGEGEVLLKTRYISLDAANRAWMQGATYRSALEGGQVMAGGGISEVVESNVDHLKARGHGVRRHRLAGVRRPPGRTSSQAPGPEAADAPPERLRDRRPDGLFRPPGMRPAQAGRHCRGLGGRGVGGLDRGADRQDQGLPRGRHRRRRGEGRPGSRASSGSTRRSTIAARSSSDGCGRRAPTESTSISTIPAATSSRPACSP